MGYYVNPEKVSKEEWLFENCINTDILFTCPKEIPEGHLAVCLVNNGDFTAAGICINDREKEEFSRPSDRRPKIWLIVPIEKLKTVSNLP